MAAGYGNERWADARGGVAQALRFIGSPFTELVRRPRRRHKRGLTGELRDADGRECRSETRLSSARPAPDIRANIAKRPDVTQGRPSLYAATD